MHGLTNRAIQCFVIDTYGSERWAECARVAYIGFSDFDLPELDLRDQTAAQYSLICRSPIAGTGQVFIGILSAMADDYGTLVILEHLGASEGIETISISLLACEFSTGRRFNLGGQR